MTDPAALRARLEKALERSEMGYSERYDHDAKRFYAETGFMAPGKSMPVEMYQGEKHQAEREAAWQVFGAKLRDEFHALLRDGMAFLAAAAEREQEADYRYRRDVEEYRLAFEGQKHLREASEAEVASLTARIGELEKANEELSHVEGQPDYESQTP